MNILITGGACAGKTTCINYIKEYLSNKSYSVFLYNEVPTELINNGVSAEGIDFIKLVISKQLKQLNEFDNNIINIFDGSPLDAIKIYK